MFNRGSTNTWPLTRWLLGAKEDPSAGSGRITRHRLDRIIAATAGLNAILVAMAIAWRVPAWPFLLWLGAELALGAVRVALPLIGRRATPQGWISGLSAGLALASSASVGYGLFISLASQDAAVCALACLAAVTMICSICQRHLAAPRLVAVAIALGLGGPCLFAGLFLRDPIVLAAALQVPLYTLITVLAAYRLSKTMVRAATAEQENDRRVHHDSLTGLLNRAGLARELSLRSARGERFALLYLDLDRFKLFNDSFGRQAGDELLKGVADRLRDTCRAADTIARIGGDEFVVLTATRDADAAKAKGELIISTISDEGFFFRKEAAFVAARAGIALCPDHGGELGPLLGEADAALCQAKFAERDRCVVAGTGIQRNPVGDRRPVSLAIAQQRMMHSKAA